MTFTVKDRQFQILDFSPSHDQLLIRSVRNKINELNLDIIFKGVGIIYLPTTLNGIAVSIVKNFDDKRRVLSAFNLEIDLKRQLYLLKSEDKEYFITALSLSIYNNQLDILESSIGRYDFGDLNEKVQ